MSNDLKILAFDIETKPNLAHVWQLWDQSVTVDRLIEAHEVICFAAKWLGQRHVIFMSTHHDGKERMLQEMHNLLDEADAVLHWNGQRFDMPHMNREFLLAGMLPPSPVTQIDLMLVARKHFKFPSNSLKHVSEALGIGKKKDTGGFKLWQDCMAGDDKAWNKMKRYNIQDVKLLEEAYDKLLPWIHNHPQRNLYQEGQGCPTCGSDRVQRRGFAYTRASKYRRYQCMECGTWLRDTKRTKGTDYQRVVS